MAYQEIMEAARLNKPACRKAARVIEQGEKYLLRIAAEQHCPLDREALDESLAQVALYSNPWLVTEFVTKH